ncbi:MAG: hypothetical protein HY332_04790 [Chloroflexi bacterium]|nr:hypothetical protein [Chloroflexota bacterium]
MMLEPERAATLLAERLRRPLSDGVSRPEGDGAAPDGGQAEPGRLGQRVVPKSGRDWLARRTLEELGIHCEATGALQDLKGFLIASHRGVEIVVSDRLAPDERLAVYAHLLAHALIDEAPHASRTFFSRLEYVEGREPVGRSSAERRAEMVADALAQAILRGRLDGAPQYAYRRTREPARNAGLRPALGRLVLDICHRTSLALFWHLPRYQKLRSRPEITFLVQRLESLVRVAYAC